MFQVDNKMIQFYIYIYIYIYISIGVSVYICGGGLVATSCPTLATPIFKFFSFIGYYKTFSRVSCVT